MTENVAPGEAISSDKKMRKALSTWDLLFLSLGGIIGSGWLFAAAAAAEDTGTSAILAWIIGGVIVLIIALVYSELGAMIPRSGAIVRYGQYSHGGLAGYLFGWAYFLSAVSVPAIEAEAVITYAATYVNGLSVTESGIAVLTPLGIFLAALLMLAFFFLNYFGVRVMGKTNTGMTWWKLIIPVLTIILLLAIHFNPVYLLKLSFVPNGWSAVFSTISVSGIVFSFLGFRQALDYGGEAKTPQRSIPLATIGSVLIGIAVYSLLQLAFLGQVPYNNIPSAVVSAPFASLATSAGLVFLTYVLFADAYVSPSGTLNVYLGTSQRTLYGLGTLGYLGKSITNVNEKHRIPVLPLLASLVVGYIFFAPFPSWYELVGFISSSTVFTYIVGGSALQVFRREAKDLHRPFTLKGASILSPLAFVGATLIVYWTGWPLVPYLVIAILLGLVVYFVFKAAGKSNVNIFGGDHFKGGAWLLAYMGTLVLLSYIGETGAPYNGIGILKFPIDFVVVIIVAVGFYFWSVKSGYKTDEITEIIESGTQYVEASSEPTGGR